MPALQPWLEDSSAIRGIFALVTVYDVVAATDIEIYLSSVGYTLGDSSISFNPVLKQRIQFAETLSIDGGASISYGDIEVNNLNGVYDSWLDHTKYVWVNRPVKIYLGDPRWVTTNLANFKSEFSLVFDGVISGIDSRAVSTINIKLRDKLERLNTSITESLLGSYGTWAGGNSNEFSIKPLVFGEVHNIEPLLIDPSQLEYMVNNGNTERIIEIRDNGLPIYTDTGLAGANTAGATLTLASGTFKLSQQYAGTITVSVQGVKNSINLSTGALVTGTYSNNIANLIALIVTQYGKSGYRLDGATELDLTNLSAFQSANTQPVGIYISSRDNVINVCQELAKSIGAQIFMNSLGKLQLLRLGVYTGDTAVTITSDDILFDSLAISDRTDVVATTKLGYCKNWTVQDNLLTGIPKEHKELFAKEWLTVSASVDSTVKSTYRLDAEPVQKDTMLISIAEATSEANRLKNYFSTPRTVYKMTGRAKLLNIKLGQEVVLVHNRFGLYNSGSGKSGQVIYKSPSWSESTVELGVIV